MLTTHYMEEADQLCERVAIIDHGRLLALDTPDALKKSIGADTEIRLHAAGRPRRARRASSRQMPGVDSARVVDGTVFVYVQRAADRRCPRSSRTPTTRASRCSDVGVKETTLETVFINLTGRELRE